MADAEDAQGAVLQGEQDAIGAEESGQTHLQSRTFDYSSLGRLYSATNLEKDSATTYTYDRNGSLLTRIDGGVTTTMAYDARDRVASKTYSGSTPAVYYCYDGSQSGNCTGAPTGSSYLHGRLTMVRSNGTDIRYESYDALGRVTAHTQTTDSTAYPFTYGYNLADEVTLMHYPSGREVATIYNGAGRPNAVTGYASLISYAPFGGVTSLPLANGVTETTQYDSRLRMTSLEAKTSDQTKLLGLNYTYYNNSNVNTQQITGLGLDVTQTYTYDRLNRLANADEPGSPPVSRAFGYDARGNGWVTSGTGVAIDPFTPRDGSWFNSQNRLTNAGLGTHYDAAGNQDVIGAYTFQYDGENRLKESTINSSSVTYAYDGEGRRVKRTLGGQTTVYVYDAMGELAAEYGGETTGSGLQYLTADSLGSTRLVTNAGGGVVSRLDYLPFGEEIPAGVGGRGPLWSGASGLTLKFTGKERGDSGSENGLDYFVARYYSGAQRRFTMPDEPFADQDPADPQSWNLYAYVRNNPLTFVDPDGRERVVCTSYGDCPTLADEEFLKKYQKNNDYILANGTIYERTEKGTQGAQVGSFTGAGQELDQKGSAVVADLGSRADASNQLIALVAGGSAVVGAGAALAPVVGQAVNEAAFGPAAGRVFYHFSRIGAAGRLIDESPAGRLLHSVPLPEAVKSVGWNVLSRFWASGAAGTVNVFAEYGRRVGDLYKTELPTLLSNPFVHSIRYR